jgi:hypothetical protein
VIINDLGALHLALWLRVGVGLVGVVVSTWPWTCVDTGVGVGGTTVLRELGSLFIGTVALIGVLGVAVAFAVPFAAGKEAAKISPELAPRRKTTVSVLPPILNAEPDLEKAFLLGVVALPLAPPPCAPWVVEAGQRTSSAACARYRASVIDGENISPKALSTAERECDGVRRTVMPVEADELAFCDDDPLEGENALLRKRRDDRLEVGGALDGEAPVLPPECCRPGWICGA